MSPYAKAGRYPDHAGLEQQAVLGRLQVAQKQVARYRRLQDSTRVERWQVTCDALLDRLLEVRGR